MALFRSDRMTAASGSIGGTTFSHNRFGLYFRARRTPVNPNTTFQQDSRSSFSSAAAGWRDITELQRAGWNVYAAASPTTNALGETIHLTGAQWFTAVNSLQLLFGLTLIEDAPATPGRAALGNPTVVLDASGTPSIAVSSIDTAMNGGQLGVFLGDAQSAGVAFFAGPYQLRAFDEVTANAISITTATGRNSVPLATGSRVPYRLAGIDANGRLSTVASGIAIVQA